MQPLKLTLTAFGPYKDTEAIDFAELDGNSLFVISGNTGAGKTTIFDGICFALYGSASGQDRENHLMLRSDFADDRTHTAAELEFSLNGRTYRILRQLGHVKKGNKTKTGERYEFFERRDGEEYPCVDRQIVSEIDKKVEALLGLTQDQFKQIVMLPQGEFRKLLTSQTENKEDILRRLFKTEPYKQMIERLRRKKKATEERYNQEKHTSNTYVDSIQTTLPMREESLLFRTLDADYYNEQQIIVGLEEETAFYDARLRDEQSASEKAYQLHDKKQKEWSRAEEWNKQFDELGRKERELQVLNERTSFFVEREKQLKDAERASHIEPYEKQAESWREEERRKRELLDQVEKKKAKTVEMLRKAEAVYQQEEGRQDERDAIRSQLQRYEEMVPAVKELDNKKREAEEHKRSAQQSEGHLEKTREERQERKQRLEHMNEQIREMDHAVSQLPEKHQSLLDMREQAQTLKTYNDWVVKHEKHQQEAANKERLYEKKKAEYEKIESIWLSNQASFLASHLVEGEACPVCGSHEHPQKATGSAGGVTKTEVETAKRALTEVETNFRQAQANLDSAAHQLQETEKMVLSHDVAVDEATGVYEQLVTTGTRLKKEVDELKETKKQLDELRVKAEREKETYKQVEERERKQDAVFQKHQANYQAALAVYKDRLQNIPEAVQTMSDLEKTIAEMTHLKKEREKAWEEAQQGRQQAREIDTQVTSQVTAAREQLEETKQKKAGAESQFQDALKEAGFTEEVGYHEAKLPEDTRTQWKEDLSQFNEQLAVLRKHVKERKEALADKERVDLTKLAEEVSQLKEAYEQAYNRVVETKKYREAAFTLITQITETGKRVKKWEKELSVTADLYDVLRGQNERKISFERYLQIEYLEQIIEAANLRLNRLSNGQFLLSRSDRQESHGRQSGLAFDVYDSYTGQTRDVKTLSGGEKFNASLCLALGMSDVIQSVQGNISINTMFIDEGFGSLDEESLHKAIDTLIDLQKSGRMIGVISHVQDLKAIFPATLEVKKTKAGYSETQFVIK
ncbi:AAA family ATPase [Bacillus piscicola]|uniref:AAA family ATPase n=1 Tax=Bacillus piscicola TaxID=1632684 RepID=UPI001F099275|nr:SMC family ATPase [Bacillus piscicola]